MIWCSKTTHGFKLLNLYQIQDFCMFYLKFMDWQRIRLREAKLNKQYGTGWTLNSSRWFRLIPTHFSVKPSWDKVGQSFVVMVLQCEVILDADLPDSNFVHILGYMFSFPFRRNYDPKHDQCRQKLQIEHVIPMCPLLKGSYFCDPLWFRYVIDHLYDCIVCKEDARKTSIFSLIDRVGCCLRILRLLLINSSGSKKCELFRRLRCWGVCMSKMHRKKGWIGCTNC